MAKKLLLDSSIIVKWLNKNKEADVDKADQILKDAHMGKAILYAPELAKVEIGKTLLLGKKLSQLESKTSLTLLFALPIQFVSQSEQLAKESYAIASAYGFSYSESVYLALAEQKSAILVTENAKDLILDSRLKVIALKNYN